MQLRNYLAAQLELAGAISCWRGHWAFWSIIVRKAVTDSNC